MNRAGEGFIRAGYLVINLQSKTRFLILPHPVTNFEIQ